MGTHDDFGQHIGGLVKMKGDLKLNMFNRIGELVVLKKKYGDRYVYTNLEGLYEIIDINDLETTITIRILQHPSARIGGEFEVNSEHFEKADISREYRRFFNDLREGDIITATAAGDIRYRITNSSGKYRVLTIPPDDIGVINVEVVEHSDGYGIGHSFTVNPFYFVKVERGDKEDAGCPGLEKCKFKVGDIVKGVSKDIYSITDSNSICKVTKIDGDKMFVKLIDHSEELWKGCFGVEYWVRQEHFEPVEDSTQDERFDPVEKPSHYADKKIEVIDYIKDTVTAEGYEGYCIGNVLKYVSRYRKKNGVEDLKKARYYLDETIAELSEESVEETLDDLE